MTSEFYEHLKRFSTNPYLFIGSGFSRRFISLPTWEDTLISFFEQSTIEGDYEYFHSKSNGQLPLLATILAQEFHERWWKLAKFKESRTSFKALAKERHDIPFKIELAQIVRSYQKMNKTYSSELDHLRKSIIDGIITTNWDEFLEKNFTDYKVFVGQQQLLFSESISVGEIYKIHGCVTQPESLVVTAEDYENFNNRNAYLAAKLLTIFVEHPIIFLGYSLSDENIQQIIDSIVRCVDSKNLHKLKDRLIFVEWVKGAEFDMKDSSMKLLDNKVLPIKLITTDSFIPIFETLSNLKRHIPIKVLRKIKNSVVEFVKSTKPTSTVYIKDLETIDENTNIEYAIGVGMASQFISPYGYKAIDGNDIIEDVLNESKNYDAEKILQNTFPSLMKFSSSIFLPVFKYLRELHLLTKGGALNTEGVAKLKGLFTLKGNIPNCFLPPDTYRKKQPEIRRNHKDIKSIINAYDKTHAIVYIPLLEFTNIDLKQLRLFLSECFNDDKIKKTTNFRKLVCLYDYLRYGLGVEKAL